MFKLERKKFYDVFPEIRLEDEYSDIFGHVSVVKIVKDEKAERFVRFCDAFDIPILTVTNATGFYADKENEFRLACAAAKLSYALADATVPKVNVITGKAFGAGYMVMNSQGLGADITFAWEGAQIGMMDPKLAAGIMYDGSDDATLNEKASEYAKLQQSVDAAAARLDALVYLLEEQVGHVVQLDEHLLAAILLALSQAVVERRHGERMLEHTQVGQHGYVGNAQIGGHGSLEVNAYESHEILYASHTGTVIGFLPVKDICEYTHLLYFVVAKV